jgi:tRNA U34 5-methylaminomethyl-2-thiouridine-forming methyltransferase MnmC
MIMKSSNYQALCIQDEILIIMEKFFQDEKNGDIHSRSKAKNSLKEYLIETDDGSYTFKSKQFHGKSETMHTHHGAITEAWEKFVKPAKLDGKKEVNILDICSGIGYNAASCIEYLDDDVIISIDMVEISPETLALILLLNNPFNSYKLVKKAVEDELFREGLIKLKSIDDEIPDGICIRLFMEDARTLVKKIKGQKRYDAIFLDPFSPLKAPELYSIDFFEILKSLIKDDGLILTYTSAAPVRSAIVSSGLHVGEGPSFGRSGGTIASPNPYMIDKALSKSDERMIALSDAGLPFKDPHLTDTSHIILQRRDDERKEARGKKKFPSTIKTPLYLSDELDDGRLKRRVLKNLHKLGFPDLNSFKSRYVVCPQYHNCICGKGCKDYINSQERINEMSDRLRGLLDN